MAARTLAEQFTDSADSIFVARDVPSAAAPRAINTSRSGEKSLNTTADIAPAEPNARSGASTESRTSSTRGPKSYADRPPLAAPLLPHIWARNEADQYLPQGRDRETATAFFAC
ncbi:MAG: hypothetical protein EAZ21_11980 [Betaproteobacteria bacterium]|nr:MAG: hypothetical protein EAZ21_11980 [Betaproteobacteria bacterium]